MKSFFSSAVKKECNKKPRVRVCNSGWLLCFDCLEEYKKIYGDHHWVLWYPALIQEKCKGC